MKYKLEKDVLRKRLSEDIALLPVDYLIESNNGIFKRVTELKEFMKARTVMTYYSVKREPDTLKIAKYAMVEGKTVAFPKCYGGGVMEARAVSNFDELKPAVLGIPAPSDNSPVIPHEALDIIIVPALAYDINGYRLGYGGGYYDRYLKGINAFTVGLTRERLMQTGHPVDFHDIAVKCVITECETRYI